MPVNIIDPFSGDEVETCSVSMKAQQDLLGASTSNPQTEAQFHKSKILGEWGVIAAKLQKKQIKSGTKVGVFESTKNATRGYVYVKGDSLWQKTYTPDGKTFDQLVKPSDFETFIKSSSLKTSIPEAVAAKPKPEGVPLSNDDIYNVENAGPNLPDGTIVAVKADGTYIKTQYNEQYDVVEYVQMALDANSGAYYVQDQAALFIALVHENQGWLKPDGKKNTPSAAPKTVIPPASPSQVAAPTPAAPVNTASASPGSMSHEDVSAMFVKIKDDLAKEQGLNIKGANAALDQEVFAAIGKLTGYSAEEVKAKIDAYKAAGNKLSALKKKVMAGTYKVPEGKAYGEVKPQGTKATPAAKLNTPKKDNKPVVDPKPNGVPTVATPALADQAKEAVQAAVKADPAKAYSDEDIAAQYIIAKDAVVAASNGKWTLYSKSDELDALIYGKIEFATGFDKDQAQLAIAQYLATGKKLSALKKQLAKQGAFKPQADTLKKKSEPADAAAKAADVAAKADAGYTPTPTPATGTPPTDTGKPAPKRVEKEAQESGDISKFTPALKSAVFQKFKTTGSQSWLSSGPGSNYEGFASVQATYTELSLLQIIRIVDEEGAKKAGVANGHLFEKQVANWLTTSAGTAYIKANEEKIAKAALAAKAKAEAEKKAKEQEANQPPLPADSAQFEGWSLDKARKVSQTWLDAKPWTERQRRDLTYYTGSAYREMNSHLRLGQPASDRAKNAIEGARQGMRPTTEPVLLKRGTGASQFSNLGLGNGDGPLTFGLTGKTFKDEGFLSTSAGGSAAFGGECLLEVECPVGTPMAYVAPISKFPGENEMLLQAGTEYKILNVRRENGQYVIRMRVVNWPGKAS